jgi:hypothetical protein
MQSSNQFDQRQAEVVRRNETPFAALTLTRTASLAVLSTGTVITWQSQTRGIGITWATTDVTIPTSGFYLLELSLQYAANVTGFASVTVNGTLIGNFMFYSTATTRHVGAFMRYYSTGDTLRITVTPSANTTLNVAAEGVLQESPILSIVQLTGAIP